MVHRDETIILVDLVVLVDPVAPVYIPKYIVVSHKKPSWE
jgi:hypothetical protein